jgi:hypothetical protein
MEKDTQEVHTEQPQAEETKIDQILEAAGRKFDLYTEVGRVGLKNFVEGLSYVTGKLSNEVGDLRKEVAPLRKYSLTDANVDDVAIMQAVEKHRANGEEDEAIRLLFEYNKQVQKSLRGDMEFERLFSDYLVQNPGVRDNMDASDIDIYKDYIRRNHMEQLVKANNPFDVLDSVLGRKSKAKAAPAEKKEDTDSAYATVGAGRAVSPPQKTEAKDEPKRKTFNEVLDELDKLRGF